MNHIHCNNNICDLILKRDLFPQNYYDQTLTFNRSSFRHFVQEVNEIWYPRRGIIKLVGYQISLCI